MVEKERKFSLVDFTAKALRVPRTFVFDQQIPENEYHLYIDPDEYYNEEFDACRNEFQNYRTSSIQKKHMKTMTNFKQKKAKNIRLCTTQNSMRIGKGFLKSGMESKKLNEISRKFDILEKKPDVSRKKSEILQLYHFEQPEKQESLNKSFERSEKKGETKEIIDGISSETTQTIQDQRKFKENFTNCKWNKKEMELSREIRENDKTHILIEKTKRALRRNEAECAKLKRRVNDGEFIDKFPFF